MYRTTRGRLNKQAVAIIASQVSLSNNEAMKKHILVSAVVALVVSVCNVGAVSATSGTHIKSATYLRSCTYDMAPEGGALNKHLCVPIRDLSLSTPLTMLCWKDDFGKRWFLVKIVDGFEGYVDEPSVGSQTTVPYCGNAGLVTQKVLAADWALLQVGQTETDAEVEAHYSTSSHYWAWWCYRFAHFAWFKGTQVNSLMGPSMTAQGAWNTYVAQGKATVRVPGQPIQPPPYGAMVFWSYGTDGHVGIAVGGNRVVDTKTPNGAAVKWEDLNGLGLNYLGWVPIERMITN
jgi:hypothetical protein